MHLTLALRSGLTGQEGRGGHSSSSHQGIGCRMSSDQQQMWSLHESTVRYAASIRSRVPIVNSRDWQRSLGIAGRA